MSFQLPNNVPSFSSGQRHQEDGYWRSSARAHGQSNGHTTNLTSGIGDKINGFFDDNQKLPMYKDKPYTYGARRPRKLYRRKRVLFGGLLFVLLVIYWLGIFGSGSGISLEERKKNALGWLKKGDGSVVDWDARRERVKEAFELSWDGYEQYAWGQDEYHPVSKHGRNMVDNGMGWIIVDALDTLILMNLTSRLSHAREWISTSLHYNQNHDVNTFETTIRMLGGLLSAQYLSTTFPNMAPLSDDDKGAPGEDLYLEKATDLADRILGAFESESGIPFASFNLNTSKGIPSHADSGASSTAEAATLQLEFKYLSKLTGETHYWEKAEKVIQVIDDNGMEDGLLPIYVYPGSGNFKGDNIRLGSRGDSYYEYLIKQYLQTSKEEPVYLEMWDEALKGVRKHLIAYTKNAHLTVLGERPNGLNGELSPKMDHLVCFMPGTIALAATGGRTEAEAKKEGPWGAKQDSEMALARELMKTCWGMYRVTETGLAPEIAYFAIDDPPKMEKDGVQISKPLLDDENASWRKDYVIHSPDRHNLQRPETVESLFYMWRITGESMYRRWGWEMFKAFIKYTAVEDGAGFTSLDNANQIPPSQRDNMESFWLAETLKYFYLLFSPKDLMPLDKIVINTEAHIFPRFDLGKTFKTGWKRKPRDKDGKIIPDTKEELKTNVVQVEKVEASGA